MRIGYLVTTGDGLGGTERAAITQANLFAAGGHDATLVSVYRETGKPIFNLAEGVALRYLVDLPLPTSTKPIVEQANTLGGASRIVPREWDDQFCVATDMAASNFLSTFDVDVLVTTTPGLTMLAAEFAMPHVVVVEQEHKAPHVRSAAHVAPLLTFAPRIDCVVCLAQASTDYLRERLGEAAPRLETIPNAIPSIYYPRADLDSNVIIAAGRYVNQKNFKDLIAAFALASSAAPGWTLRIYGQGPNLDALRRQIRTLHLENSVELIPAVPDMITEWSKGAIFALSSDNEGFPLVALEAMAAGLPLVAYDCPTGPADIVDDGVNGTLIPHKSVEVLAEGLKTLMQDSALRYRYSQASLDRVSLFSPESIYQRWLNLFNELLQDSGMPRLARALNRTAAASLAPGPAHTQHIASTAPSESNAQRAGTPTLRPLDDLTPIRRTRRILGTAVGLLDDSQITYFWLPNSSPRHQVLAVPASYRSAMFESLAGSRNLPGVGVFPLRGTTRATTKAWFPGVEKEPSSPLFQTCAALRLFDPVTDERGILDGQDDLSCEIEFWTETEPGLLSSPRQNPAVDLVRTQDLRRLVVRTVAGLDVKTIPLLTDWSDGYSSKFPIDAVYTWVDDSDQAWRARKDKALGLTGGTDSEGTVDARFRNRDELKYSLRSLSAYAPWVRNVFLVTDSQRPNWLADAPGLTVVDHRDIFPDVTTLPVFNSHAIEAALHRIEGLSEHFLYLNDDVMLARPQSPATYFEETGAQRFFPSPVKINDLGEAAPPHLGAAANHRTLIKRDFGVTISRSFLHTPYALQTSVLHEVAERYPREWEQTLRSRFRSGRDICAWALSTHLAYATGRAIPGEIGYRYLNLGDEDLDAAMISIIRSRDIDVVALGDPATPIQDPLHVDKAVRTFLETLLPWPSRFERT